MFTEHLSVDLHVLNAVLLELGPQGCDEWS